MIIFNSYVSHFPGGYMKLYCWLKRDVFYPQLKVDSHKGWTVHVLFGWSRAKGQHSLVGMMTFMNMWDGMGMAWGILKNICFIWLMYEWSMENLWIIYGYISLVVEPYPSEKSESLGMMTFPTEWKNKKGSKAPTSSVFTVSNSTILLIASPRRSVPVVGHPVALSRSSQGVSHPQSVR